MEEEERERGSVVEDIATTVEEEEVVADTVAVGKRGREGKSKKSQRKI